MSEIIIDTAQSIDYPEAALVTARAMITNPLVVAVFNGAQEIFEIINRVSFESGSGRIYLAKEKEQILGVMRITEWPDCHAKFRGGYKLPPPAVAILKDSAPRMEQWLQTWGERDPEKHHWHLTLLAVLPERQRQGIGKKLVNLKVVSTNDKKLNFERTFVRNISKIHFVFLILDTLSGLFYSKDPNQKYTDQISQTTVI